MNIQIAKKPITETESDQASPDLANEYSLAMQKANHRNCVQCQWGKSVSKKCVQRVCPKSGSPNDNTPSFIRLRGCVGVLPLLSDFFFYFLPELVGTPNHAPWRRPCIKYITY